MKPKIYVFFGMIASGKSFLARSFAQNRNYACYNTDRVRKELAGLDPVTNCPDGFNQGIYTQEFSLKTYGALLDRAGKQLQLAKAGVVLDGSYSSRLERSRVREFAAEQGAEVFFILCTCREKEIKQRLAKRACDPLAVSDGDWKIYLSQQQFFEPPDELSPHELIIMDTEHDIKELLSRLDTLLNC